MTKTQNPRMWWLQQGDHTTGPHTEDHFTTGPETGTINRSLSKKGIIMTEWFLIQDGKEHGPLSTQEMRQLTRTGKLQPHNLVKRGANGDPVRADKISGLFTKPNTGQQATLPPPLPPKMDASEPPVAAPQKHDPSFLNEFRISWKIVAMSLGGIGLLGFLMIALLLIVGLANDSTIAPTPQLNLSWSDGTVQLMPLVKSFSSEQKASLGFGMIENDIDVFAASIQLQNTGNTPVQVSPEHLRVYFGNEVTTVYFLQDDRFLQPTILQPGEYASGLVTYLARLDSSDKIMSYQDDTIQVIYDVPLHDLTSNIL